MTHDRYRVAEVEWIQDIMPTEGTRERETVSSLKFWYECVCKVTVMLDIMLLYFSRYKFRISIFFLDIDQMHVSV